jgi:hypothetical protein
MPPRGARKPAKRKISPALETPTIIGLDYLLDKDVFTHCADKRTFLLTLRHVVVDHIAPERVEETIKKIDDTWHPEPGERCAELFQSFKDYLDSVM